MKRYSMGFFKGAPAMFEQPEGDYVKWADVDELRRACAEIIDADPATWPDHGNVALAIAATLALRTSELKRHDAGSMAPSSDGAEALRGLRNLKVLLGTDAPEVRGWAPAVQQAAQKAINTAIRVLAARGVPPSPEPQQEKRDA